MATIAPQVNLTLPILTELTSKLDKQPQVTEVALSDDGSTTSEEHHFTETVVSGVTTVVCEHNPVRSSLHKEAVYLRQDLQLHLRSVMKTGDDMLVKIRGIVEELDIAVHEKQLAVEELSVVVEKRKQLQLQYDSVSKECSVLRIRILEMSKARDRAEIDLEVCKGQLLEKEEECNELKRESGRLHIQITELTHKLLEYTSRLTDAEGKVRFYIQEVTSLKLEIESLKVELKTSTELSLSLGKDLAGLRFENKDLKLEVERVRHELISATTKLTTITIELTNAKEEARKAIIIRDEAVAEREQAIKDRDAAVIIAVDAASKRDDAIRARDQAIFNEQSTNKKWLRDSLLLEDCQRSLISVRKTVDIITVERNTAIQQAENWEHLRDEAIENFREADAARHRLSRELVKAGRDKKDIEYRIEIEIGKTREAIYDKELIIKEKEMVEVRLGESEREKNAAIAKKAKVLEDYAQADKERDEAIKKYEDMEDKFQNADKNLAVSEQAREIALGNEKAAVFQMELLSGKLTKSQESEAALTKDRDAVVEKLKTSQSVVEQTKKELTDTKTKLETTTTELTTAGEKIKALESRFIGPGQEQKGVLIRNIFFGSARLTNPTVYQGVIDSWLKKDVTFQATPGWLQNNTNNGQSGGMTPRWMGVFYAVRQKGELVDQLPIWFSESDKQVKFSPKGI